MSIEEIKLAIAFILFIGTAGLSSWITHKVDNAAYTKLELSYAQAEEKAVKTALDNQTQLDGIKTQVALEANIHQQKITNQTRNQLSAVKKYVKSNCLSWGSIKLLDAQILGRDPSSMSTPSGESDDSLSTFTADQLVGSIITNYGTAKQNAQQLDDLIGALHRMYDKKDTK